MSFREVGAVWAYDGIEECAAASGDDLGTLAWPEVDRACIRRFAEATGSDQRIHDPQLAADGAFAGISAHGFLTLSLLPPLLNELYSVDDVAAKVNDGLGNVRGIAPVKVGNGVRRSATIRAAMPPEGAVQATFASTVETEGADKLPAAGESTARFVA